jgi:hypothetical protein
MIERPDRTAESAGIARSGIDRNSGGNEWPDAVTAGTLRNAPDEACLALAHRRDRCGPLHLHHSACPERLVMRRLLEALLILAGAVPAFYLFVP